MSGFAGTASGDISLGSVPLLHLWLKALEVVQELGCLVVASPSIKVVGDTPLLAWSVGRIPQELIVRRPG
jgi:hypothetical protein